MLSAFELFNQNYFLDLLDISKPGMNGGHGTWAEVPANVSGKQLQPSNCPVQYVPMIIIIDLITIIIISQLKAM